MPCNASYTRFIFGKVFHMYYNVICILYALLCRQNFILVKSGCYTCLDDVADYFSLAKEEVEFQDLEQVVKPETSPVGLKQLPPGLQYVFQNGDRETPVIISDKLTNDETRKLVATLEKYRSVIGYSLKDLKGISPSLHTHRIPMEQDHKPVHEHQ
jgi:hypothetical protein